MSLLDWTKSETISQPDRITIKWKTEATGNTSEEEREQLLLSTTKSVSTSTFQSLSYTDADGNIKTQDVQQRKVDTKTTTKASINQEWISARLKFNRGLPAGNDDERSETDYEYQTSTDGPVLIKEVTRVFISIASLAGQLQGIPYWWSNPSTPTTYLYFDPPAGEIISQRTEVEYEQVKTAEGRDLTRTKTSRWVALGLTSEGKGSFERWMKVIKDLAIQSSSLISDSVLQWSELVFQGTEVQVSTGRAPVPTKPSDAELAAAEVVNGSESYDLTGGTGEGGSGTDGTQYKNQEPQVNNDKIITGQLVFDEQNYNDSNPTVTATYQMPYAPDDYFYFDDDNRELQSSFATDAAIKFGQTEAALDIGHAYGQNIVTNFDFTPTLEMSPVYIRMAGIEGAFLLDGVSYAWGPEGMVVSSDLMLIGVTGYDGVTPPATSWLRLPVTPASIGPVGATTIEASPAKANTINIPNGFDVRNLASVFAALPINQSDVFREWRDDAAVITPALVLDREVIAAGPTIQAVEYPYELDAGTDAESIASGPVMDFVWATRVVTPAAAVTVAASAPAISTGVLVAVPAAGVSVAVVVPEIRKVLNLLMPAADVAVAALSPESIGKLRTNVFIPAANTSAAALAPLVVSGASATVPSSDIATAALIPSLSFADRSWANVIALLHMNGSNNSTTFTNSASNAATFTANGNAKLSTDQAKFGTASGYLDGNGDYISASSTAVRLSTGDHTVEFWVYPTVTTAGYMWSQYQASSAPAGRCYLALDANSKVILQLGSNIVTGTTTISANTWVHIAYVRSGTTNTLYVGGVDNGSFTSSQALFSGAVRFGTQNNGSEASPSFTNYFTGYFDELRITKAARYTAAFTPPTVQFPDA
jgi:hypothetical protein